MRLYRQSVIISVLKWLPPLSLGWVKFGMNVLKISKLATFSGLLPPGINRFLEWHDYGMYLLFSSDNWPWKADALQIACGGVEGRRKVPIVVHFGILRELVLFAIFQTFISLSIQWVRGSFFAQIEAVIKEIPHKKLILKKDPLKRMILVSKSTVKSQNSRLPAGSQVQMLKRR